MLSLKRCPDCYKNKWVDVDDVLRRCAECKFIVHRQWLEEKIETLDEIKWSD